MSGIRGGTARELDRHGETRQLQRMKQLDVGSEAGTWPWPLQKFARALGQDPPEKALDAAAPNLLRSVGETGPPIGLQPLLRWLQADKAIVQDGPLARLQVI